MDRALALLERRPPDPHTEAGYLDLLGARSPVPPTAAQRLMNTRLVPAIYERIWRRAGGALAMGMGPAREYELTRELLALEPGAIVLDVACGPGNFTRRFADEVGADGLVVGIDASVTMLDRAVEDTAAANVAYVRGDAERLPFRDGSFDAVCCYAAMYMFERPFTVLDELVRVLAPGGRVAVMTSLHRGPEPLLPVARLWARPGGMKIFGRREVTGALARRGCGEVEQRVAGLAQFVGATAT